MLAPPDPRLHNRGDRMPWKFTNAERDAMIEAYVADIEPLSAIAERFGCSRAWPLILAKRAGYPGRRAVRERR